MSVDNFECSLAMNASNIRGCSESNVNLDTENNAFDNDNYIFWR